MKKLGALESAKEIILLYETLTFNAVADPTWSKMENLNVSNWLNDISNLKRGKKYNIFGLECKQPIKNNIRRDKDTSLQNYEHICIILSEGFHNFYNRVIVFFTIYKTK